MRYLLIALTLTYLAAVLGPMVAIVLKVDPKTVRVAHSLELVRMALVLTLKTSLIVTVLTVVLCLPIAICLARLEFRGKTALDMLVDVPIALPPLVLGVGLLLLWGRRGMVGQYLDAMGIQISFTTLAVCVAQFVVASPYFVRIAQSGLQAVPRELEDVARSLGARPLRVWATVTLPMAREAILAATITCWARAVSEFGATLMFAGNFPGRSQTMPLAIYVTMQFNIEDAVLMSAIMLVFALAGFAAAQHLLRRYGRPRALAGAI
ncbi:MAG: ABC transporter permease [Armatimonadetes bacterium]|nr:ABC transporter permease [Armatimonadota bacterium]